MRRSRTTVIAARSVWRRSSAASPWPRSVCRRARSSRATLSCPGLRAPSVRMRRMASSRRRLAIEVPRSAPLIDSCSRSRRALSSLSRFSSSWWRTLAVERKNFSEARPVSSTTRASMRAGSNSVSPSNSSRALPLVPAKVLTRRPSRPSCSKPSSMRGSSAASQVRSDLSSSPVAVERRKRTISMACWMVDLPASLGPRMTVRPAAGRRSRSRCRRTSWSWRRVIFTVRPGSRDEGRRADGGPAAGPPGPRPRRPRCHPSRRPRCAPPCPG